ncbi:MAG TPA: hypothetical protein VN665_00025 [Candidatus Paceibacterota bacterium]|nr:hypothetical protein [Candidatus Paceibacterota bacterium]
MYTRLAAVLLVFFGEAFSIAAELVAAKRIGMGGNYPHIFILATIVVIFGGAMLIAGYMLGYLYLKNIWIIAAISVGSILIVEPIVAYALFRQMPTLGAGIGLVLGVLGTLAALFL